jgi:hypothetical protein
VCPWHYYHDPTLASWTADNLTVSTASGDGPKAGKLIGFYSDDPQGRPCEVALICNTP